MRELLKIANKMDQSDITYVIEMLTDAKINKDWDAVEDAVELLKEFLDEEVVPCGD